MIKSKRIAVAAMAAVLALAGAACGSDDPVADEPAAEEEAAEEPAAEEEAAEEPAEEAGPFLGLAFDTGGRGDGTFNDMAGQGADNAEANLSIAVQELEATSDQDANQTSRLLQPQVTSSLSQSACIWWPPVRS